MGFSISWLAFRGTSKDNVLKATGLYDTGASEEVPESAFNGATLPEGWYLLWLEDVENAFTRHEELVRLSRECEIVGCQIEEHVMVSIAFKYQNGQRVFYVSHESEKGRYDLSVDGTPPSQFEVIRRGLVEKQNNDGGESSDVDYIFDVPTELAQSICGFKHDIWEFDWGRPEFTILRPIKA